MDVPGWMSGAVTRAYKSVIIIIIIVVIKTAHFIEFYSRLFDFKLIALFYFNNNT